jgi:hypothetical protein
MLGLGWFRMTEQISAFSEFCNVGARPVYALCFLKFSGKSILMPLHRGAQRAPKVRWALRWLERKRLKAEILRGMQLMHLCLMLDAFNPILATAVLEAKDLPPLVMFSLLFPLRRQIEDRRHYASCVTGDGVLLSTPPAWSCQLWWLLVRRSQA